ncbi:MAG: sensor histidine kinase [Corynebacterium sp.]|uniref:sensor histidine kinase n=1 Tax=Corynebacterium sp. TaxID=1720 RepID=UPI003F9AB432
MKTVNTANVSPQAQPGPFWRDRGFWLQLVIQVAVFFMFGVGDAGNASRNGASAVLWFLLVGGYALVFAGLVVQRWWTERGLVMVAAGLVAAAASMSGIYILAYLVVCYEAWYISAYVRRRRGMWLAALLVGSVVSVVALIVLPVMDTGWSPRVDPTQYAVDWNQVFSMVPVFLLVAVLSIGLFWQLGLTTRRQQERMETLATRVELAASAERTRIAREMHDIVAHSLTAVIAQADGGRYAGRHDPGKAIEALDTISMTGRDALSQMRQLLSVLREGGTDPSRGTGAPPGVGGVPELVEDARRSGLVVDYRVLGEPVVVDVATGLTVFRTVQECLTNILKHAGPTQARLLLDWNVPGKLRISVDNAPGHGLVESSGDEAGRGQGLVGLQERARILGGTAEWGPSPTFVGGWQVDVTLEVG